jgi:hypothetical protein
MANGRMITNCICADKRINQLSSDTSRLAFTWLVTFADREGRTYGDPAMVRSMLFPRRQDVSIEEMEQIIIEWATIGLVIWYEDGGDLWIRFPSFEKNQPGLRKDKEAPSKIPEPTEEGTELVRTRYGLGTDLVPVKLKEEKGKEEKGMEAGASSADYPIAPEIELYHTVTCLYPTFTDEERIKQKVVDIRKKHNNPPINEMIRIMTDKYSLWKTCTTKDGKPYNPSNPDWLDWCITDFSPQIAKPRKASEVWQ